MFASDDIKGAFSGTMNYANDDVNWLYPTSLPAIYLQPIRHQFVCGSNSWQLWPTPNLSLVGCERPEEANRLIGIWLNTTEKLNERESIQRFVSNSFKGGDFWVTEQLLENYPNQHDIPADAHFEMAAIRCLSLTESLNLLVNEPSITNSVSKAQVRWIASSTTTNHLEKLAAESGRQALQQFTKIKQPTEVQTNLLKRLNLPVEIYHSSTNVP